MGNLAFPDNFPSVGSMPGWNSNETIAESIIQTALSYASGLNAGRATAGIGDVIAYFSLNGLLTIIENALTDDINQGGYGLDPQDEDDIWNRARDRENINAQFAMEEAKRNYSMSGLSLPSGALTKSLERAALVAVEKNSSVNRDLAIKKADLYWDGKKFVFTTAIALKQLILSIQTEMAKIHASLNIAAIEADSRIIAAALSMMNMNASVSNSFSRSQSMSASESQSLNGSISNSYSESLNTNHNYNHEA